MASITYTSYELVGAKEDISDVISNIDPTDTPFSASISDERISQKLYQWQEDHLDAPALNAQPEGFDAVYIQPTPTKMRNNNTQILAKTFSVSESTNATDSYGRTLEISYQVAKGGEAIKRDWELTCVGTAQTQVSGDDSTATNTTYASGNGAPRQTASYQAMIDNGTGSTANAMNILYATGSAASNTTAVLQEVLVSNAMQQLYTVGGKATILMLKPADMVRVAAFAAGTQTVSGTVVATKYRTVASDTTTVVNSVEIYKTPFGALKVMSNRFQRSVDALLYDPASWKRCVFRPWTRTTLAKTGDAIKMMIVGEFGLKNRNYRSSAYITQLT